MDSQKISKAISIQTPISLQPVLIEKIQSFESRNVTTMVAVVGVSGEIFPAQAFTLLPITRVELPETKGTSKNIQLPHHPISGSVLSMRYENETRGIILKVKKDTHFRNSITIDMSISEKNVNFRLSKSTIHMCGVRSFEQIKETANLIFKHLKVIQEALDYLHQKPILTASCFNYIKNNIRSYDSILKIEHPSPEIDPYIFEFMTRNLPDHSSATGFITELKWIIQQTKVYTAISDDILSISKIETSMINKNYDIGFEINRRALARYIKQIDEFYLDYDNAITHSVKIMLPFEIPKNSTIRRKQKKNDIPHHTFMVYKSGCVTQSGPSLELMEDAYYRFFKAIYGLRHLIEKRKNGVKNQVRIRIVPDDNSKEISESSESPDNGPEKPREEEIRIEDITESDI